MNILSSIKNSDLLGVRSLIRIVVALALIGLIFSYPGAISPPYDDSALHGSYDNQIVEQASSVESIEHPAVTDETIVYQYSELSPVAKEVFDKTRSTEDNAYTIILCHDWTLTCDEYYESEVPYEFQYGAVGDGVEESELYTVIETEGEAYVLQTGALGHGDGWDLSGVPLMLSSSLMVLLVSGALVYTAIRPPKYSGDGFPSWDVVFASLIGVFALAVPYLHMWDILSVTWSRALITAIVPLGISAYYFGLGRTIHRLLTSPR